VAASRESVAYDIQDVKVYVLLTDSTAASPTYGPGIDVPGIAELTATPQFTTAELKGDAKIFARRGRLDKFSGTLKFDRIALNVMTAVIGGSVTDLGTGTAEEARYDFLAPASLPYFRVEGLIADTETELGISNIHVIFAKCQLTGGTLLTAQSDTFSQPTLNFDAIPPQFAASPLIRIRMLESATALDA
jgi:hypothetical protein